MVPIFNLRGFTAVDPLDRAPAAMRFVLTIAVSGALAFAFLYTQSAALNVTTFPSQSVMWIGIAIYAFVMAPLLVVLRKSSSLLFYLMIVSVCVPVDIFRQAHYPEGWWVYQPGSFLSPMPVPLKFLVAWSFDGLIQGPLALWLARLLASVIYPASKSAPEPTTDQQEALFPIEWTNEEVAKPSRDIGYWLLRLLGFGYLLYMVFCAIGALGASVWPAQAQQLIVMTYANPALGVNTFSKISLMVLLAFVGAYNRNVRWHCVLGLIAGHSASTVASLSFYFLAPTTDYHSFLLTSAIVDGVMVLIFAYLLVRYRKAAAQFAPRKEYVDFISLPDELSRIFFYALSAAMMLSLIGAVLLRVMGSGASGLSAVYGYPDPQLCNTITRFSTLSVLAFLLAKREKLRDYLTSILIAGFVVTLIGSSVFLLLGTLTDHTRIVVRGEGVTHVDWYFSFQIAADALIVGGLIGLRKLLYNVDYVINALNPSSAQNVIALHQAFYGGDVVEDSAVLGKIDRQVAGISGSKRGLLNFPFWIVEHLLSPIFGLHPTFSNMSSDEGRQFLRKYVLRPPRERMRAFIPALAELAYKIGMAVDAFVTFAHYTTVKGWEEVGYIPPDARDRLQGDYPSYAAPANQAAALPNAPGDPANDKRDVPTPKPLIAPRIAAPFTEPAIPDEVDYLIVGSGAGGACMAYRLACEASDPSRILVIETGRRYSPLQDFNDDEMEMIRKLYKEGGLQQSKKFDLMVLQGECVGGTTVINNAVCLQMPQAVREVWQNEYGLDLSSLDDELDGQGRVIKAGEYTRVGQEIEITQIAEIAINQRVAQKFKTGIAGLLKQGAPLSGAEVLSANQRDMLGDGLCNLGNKRLRKRSMLETYLPWAEARGVKIVSQTTALCLVRDSAGKRAEAVLLRTSHGATTRVRVRKAVIASAGVIASSHFLMRSGVTRNVGQRMSCNFALDAAFEFADVLDAFDGVQITMGAFDSQNRAAFETYFNPPGAFALSLPFYFDRSRDLIKRYRYLLNFGSLVGSEPNGVIQLKGDPVTGRPFTWVLGQRDQANIKYAIGTLLDLGLAAGATRGVLPTEPGIEIPLTPANVSRFKQQLENYPLRMSDLRLATAHPQGGNGMAGDGSPNRNKRVVDSNFRVDGFENVFVADASVFPTGITVNPQWTIMALSSMAAGKILSLCESRAKAAGK
ncbi:MAG TPA: GMC family oxidoreductase N-terminal domain-containing protein [Blastocatellia bacterium]|nr:GMC family oxidoreductase N-terminal domain-containing protein [Blastocatellia bacterium]